MPDERLQFALEILNGEPDAHRIVADLLEEQGEPGLASWARGRKNNGRKRLEFAISLLPPEAAIRLGCDFADHALDRLRPGIRFIPQLANAVASIRDAFAGWPDPAELEQSLVWADFLASGIPQHEYFDSNIGPWDRVFAILTELRVGLQELSSAVRHALSAVQQRRDGNERKAVHLEQLARDAIRKLSRRTREASLSTGRPEPAPRRRFFGLFGGQNRDAVDTWIRSSSAKADELRWQMERTKAVIEELLHESPAR